MPSKNNPLLAINTESSSLCNHTTWRNLNHYHYSIGALEWCKGYPRFDKVQPTGPSKVSWSGGWGIIPVLPLNTIRSTIFIFPAQSSCFRVRTHCFVFQQYKDVVASEIKMHSKIIVSHHFLCQGPLVVVRKPKQRWLPKPDNKPCLKELCEGLKED